MWAAGAWDSKRCPLRALAGTARGYRYLALDRSGQHQRWNLFHGHANETARSFKVTKRILFLGENWFGSCARACCHALRRLGCEVADFDAQTIFPQLRRRSLRAILRVAEPQLIREYNEQVRELAQRFEPDIFL